MSQEFMSQDIQSNSTLESVHKARSAEVQRFMMSMPVQISINLIGALVAGYISGWAVSAVDPLSQKVLNKIS